MPWSNSDMNSFQNSMHTTYLEFLILPPKRVQNVERDNCQTWPDQPVRLLFLFFIETEVVEEEDGLAVSEFGIGTRS